MFLFGSKNENEFYPDDPEHIYLDNQGDSFYDLTCEPEIFDHYVEVIKNQIRDWMLHELAVIEHAETLSRPVEHTLAYRFNNFDIKFAPYDENMAFLDSVLAEQDSITNISRMMDMFVRIQILIPVEVREAITGRFLYAMCYGISDSICEVPLPSKRQWLKALAKYPWIPYISFLQELYRSDQIYSERLPIAISANRQNNEASRSMAVYGPEFVRTQTLQP